MSVRTGNCKALVMKKLGESAHADAADTDKVNFARVLVVNVSHNFFSLVSTLFSLLLSSVAFLCYFSLLLFPITFICYFSPKGFRPGHLKKHTGKAFSAYHYLTICQFCQQSFFIVFLWLSHLKKTYKRGNITSGEIYSILG